MSKTYKDLVYIVLDELKIFSDDSSFEPEHIVHTLNKYRALLFDQKYRNKKIEIPRSFYQRLKIDLEKPYVNGGIYRSSKTLPDILEIRDIYQYTFISKESELKPLIP